jgi:ubiquinone/menaquinone biosynthesis C-methylase UbiE
MQKLKSIKECYDNEGLNEWRRLIKDPFHLLEYETTFHFLKKYLPKKGLILDAGGGPGRYSIQLAKMGYDMVLFDISPKLLLIAQKKIAKAGVKRKIKQVVEGSITDLSLFQDNTFDAVLCLGGPVSHVSGEQKRREAVSELVRVARKNAPVFVSVIGRLAVLSSFPRYWVDEMKSAKRFEKIWQEGEDYSWRGSHYCHFFMPEEFEELMRVSGLKIMARVGLEGLGANLQKEINHLASHHPIAWENWLKAHYALCTRPNVFAISGHMLMVGKKE